jgi:hypothetical protein
MLWDGPATKRRGGDTHYLAFVLGDERYALGGPLCRALSLRTWDVRGAPARRRCQKMRDASARACALCVTCFSSFSAAPDRVLMWTGGSEAGKDRDHVLARLDNMWEDCCGKNSQKKSIQ